MNRTSAFKLFLIGLLSLTTNVMAQAQAKSDSMAKFGISIPDAYSITTINSSKIGFMTQQSYTIQNATRANENSIFSHFRSIRQ